MKWSQIFNFYSFVSLYDFSSLVIRMFCIPYLQCVSVIIAVEMVPYGIIDQFNTMGATCRAGSAYPSGAPEITPCFWWGSYCFFFSFLYCVMCTIVCLFFLFIFSHGVVSLLSIYEFDCPSDIFRSSFNSTYIIQFE